MKKDLASVLGVQLMHEDERYLGAPLFVSRRLVSSYKYLIEKTYELPTALWAQILKAKYFAKDSFVNSITKALSVVLKPRLYPHLLLHCPVVVGVWTQSRSQFDIVAEDDICSIIELWLKARGDNVDIFAAGVNLMWCVWTSRCKMGV